MLRISKFTCFKSYYMKYQCVRASARVAGARNTFNCIWYHFRILHVLKPVCSKSSYLFKVFWHSARAYQGTYKVPGAWHWISKFTRFKSYFIKCQCVASDAPFNCEQLLWSTFCATSNFLLVIHEKQLWHDVIVVRWRHGKSDYFHSIPWVDLLCIYIMG